MHACGHDGHTAALLGAARILNQMKDEFTGTVKLFFEAAEEIGGSIRDVKKLGFLEGLDGCFAIHIWSELAAGKISAEAGPRMAATGVFHTTITGKGGHASQPHQGVDAALVAAAVLMNLQSIVSRELNPQEPATVSVGRLVAGTRFNVLAENAILDGNIRSFNQKIQDSYLDIIQRIAGHTAAAYRATAVTTIDDTGTPVVDNTPEQAAFTQGVVKELFGEDALGHQEKVMAGEDFGLFMQWVKPGMFVFVGGGNESKGCCYAHHNGHFNFDEDALPTVASLHAQYALDFLNSRAG
jgi:amidohydrolase